GGVVQFERARQRGIDVPRPERMHRARMDEGYGEHDLVRELPFNPDGALHHTRRPQILVHLADSLWQLTLQQALNRRNIRKEFGMVHHKPPLGYAVESDGLEDQVFAEAVVEEPRAGADYGLSGFSAPRSRRPCEAEPRSRVGPIVKMVLGLVPQTHAEGETGTHPPIILDIDSRFRLRQSALGNLYPG